MVILVTFLDTTGFDWFFTVFGVSGFPIENDENHCFYPKITENDENHCFSQNVTDRSDVLKNTVFGLKTVVF